MEFTEFRDKVQKKSNKGKFKVTNSWGVYDAYKHIRKNGWYDLGRPLTEHEFYSIIRSVNKLLAEELANGNTITFPSKMGQLEIRKQLRGVSIVDGNLKITYPIDWSETLKLWYEDEESRKKKTLLRMENKDVYVVKYAKRKATYENKGFYDFVLNRFIKIALKENINKGKIETLW